MTKPSTFVLFVYGSLKRGFGNHRLLENLRAKFLGEAKSEPVFTMYSLGGFPGIIRNGDTPVSGELYEVPSSGMSDLDMLEGHPNFYRREDIRLENGQVVLGYVLPVRSEYVNGCPVIDDGVWKRQIFRR